MFKTSSDYRINNQTILKEHIDEHYEPTDEEIREYALYIGIDPDKESELLWLAKEGLMKPLPSGWKACQDENEELYYFNFDTGKSSWDHPYDDIYKARVIQEREKRSSIIIMPDTHSKGKNTSSLSDLSSEKNPSHFPLSTKNKHETNQSNSEELNSDPENELMNSEEFNQTDFQKDIDFGIDRKLSASIEEENQRRKQANLAAQAAERRLHLNQTVNEETEQTRFEQSIDEEKLRLFEENYQELEKLKQDLAMNKEREERSIRVKYENELKIFEKQTEENFIREKKFLETRQINQLNILKQTIEKEKLDLQNKLRADMLADLKLEQQNNTNIQIQLLQMKTEADEKYRSMENRYKTQIDELTRCCEKIKAEKETVEKRLKEKIEQCSTVQRELDQLRVEKTFSELENSRMNSVADEISVINQNPSVNNVIDDELSDTDSDVVQMNLTLNQLKTYSVDFSKSNHPQFGRSMSYEQSSNSSLIDSGRWSNTLLSSMNNSYLSSTTKNPFWQSQPSLITREAVLKAARDVLPAGVIDHLTSKH